MLVGVMADTHDNMPMIQAALTEFQRRGVEAILHAGDIVAPFALTLVMRPGIRVIAVFGNNDGERRGLTALCPEIHAPPYRFQLGGRSIMMTHDIKSLGKDEAQGADLVIFGHSHDAEIRHGSPLLVNPGGGGGWLSGRSTVAIVELDEMEAEIIDLGKQETVFL